MRDVVRAEDIGLTINDALAVPSLELASRLVTVDELLRDLYDDLDEARGTVEDALNALAAGAVAVRDDGDGATLRAFPDGIGAAVPRYAPTRACSGCPYRSSCHEPRQRAVDAGLALGRHVSCEFYHEFKRREAKRADVSRWRFRLLADVGRKLLARRT